jgi:hypothetical protein
MGHRPGQIVPESGVYRSSNGTEAALRRGHRFPPSDRGATWETVLLIKSRRKKRKRGRR